MGIGVEDTQKSQLHLLGSIYDTQLFRDFWDAVLDDGLLHYGPALRRIRRLHYVCRRLHYLSYSWSYLRRFAEQADRWTGVAASFQCVLDTFFLQLCVLAVVARV